MARKLRIQYPSAIYHVMNRGDRQEPIFGDDRDRQRFLETLTEACEKTGWQVHAFCLMSNHFHLVVETPQPNLVAGMKWFLGAYTSRYNRRHKEFGHEGVSQRECNILLTADRAGGYGEPMARKLRIQLPRRDLPRHEPGRPAGADLRR